MYDLHKEHLVVFIKNHHGDPEKRREYLKNNNTDNLTDAEIEEHVASMNTYRSVLKYASPTKPYEIPMLVNQNGIYKIIYQKVWNADNNTQVVIERLLNYLEDSSKTIIDMNKEFQTISKAVVYDTKNCVFIPSLIPFDYNQAFVNAYGIDSPFFNSTDELYIKDVDEPNNFPSYFFDFLDTLDTEDKQSVYAVDDEFGTPTERLKRIHNLVKKGDAHIRRRIREYNHFVSSLKAQEKKSFEPYANIRKILSEDEIEKITYNFKLAYYINAYQYIYVPLYDNAIKQIPNVIICAHEIKGFNSVNIQISDNIELIIHTNFAYGNSSYFHTELQYAKQPIALFSYLLEFAYIRAFQILKYTKLHKVKRRSWKDALWYAKEVYDIIKSGGEQAFLEKYIVGELNKFLRYFEELKDSKHFIVEHYFRRIYEKDGNNVHEIDKTEIKRYIAIQYLKGHFIDIREPSELPSVITTENEFKYKLIIDLYDALYTTITAEKTTGAISFIQRMRKYNNIVPSPKFMEAENKIYEMNREFKVSYCREVDNIKNKLRYIDNLLEDYNSKLELSKLELTEKDKAIKQFIPNILPKLKAEIIKLFETDERIKTIYTSSFEVGWCTSVMLNDATPEVKTIEDNINQMVGEKQKLIDAKNKLEDEIKDINAEISFLSTYKDVYNGFLGTLQECIAKINF